MTPKQIYNRLDRFHPRLEKLELGFELLSDELDRLIAEIEDMEPRRQSPEHHSRLVSDASERLRAVSYEVAGIIDACREGGYRIDAVQDIVAEI